MCAHREQASDMVEVGHDSKYNVSSMRDIEASRECHDNGIRLICEIYDEDITQILQESRWDIAKKVK